MKKLLAILAVVMLSACTHNHGNYTVMSNKIVSINNFEIDKADRIKNVKGVDRSHTIFFFDTKANPNLSDALNDAFRNADGDIMTDVTVTYWNWYIPMLYGQKGWTVEGDVVKTRQK